jgi:hypothetical protein
MRDLGRVDQALRDAAGQLSALAARQPVVPADQLAHGERSARKGVAARLAIVLSALLGPVVVTLVVVADDPAVTFAPAPAEDGSDDAVSWRQLPPPPYAPVSGQSLTFTGEGVLVWGGVGGVQGGERSPPRGGAYLELSRGVWQDLGEHGEARWDHAAVWTGREVLLWGGSTELASGSPDGARLAVPSFGYRAMPPAPFGMAEPIGVWTGEEALFWGEPAVADPADVQAAQVLRYRPRTDRWEVGARFPGPSRVGATALWTGEELLVWGGLAWDDAGDGPVAVADGYAYDPAGDVWRRIAPGPLAGRFRHAAVWTGEAMLVWGGAASEEPGDVLADGALYSAATDSWEAIPDAPLGGRDTAIAAVIGERVVIVGGQTRRSPSAWDAHADGAVFSLPQGEWGATFQTGFERLGNALLGASVYEAVLLWRGPDGRAARPSVVLLATR